LLGRRALDGMAGVEIHGVPLYDANVETWYFPVRVTIESASAYVPTTTEWFLLVGHDYPIGRVILCPAQLGGLHASFRHMEANQPTGFPWRSGTPCLDRPGRWLGSPELVNQPTSAEERMRWYVERLQEWLNSAARDALTDCGEPFELPKFGTKSPVLGFDEDPSRFAVWSTAFDRAGDATLKHINPHVWVAHEFSAHGSAIVPVRWGRRIHESERIERGFWLTLRDLPILPPWNVPRTWGELRTVAARQKVQLDVHLQWMYHHLHARRVSEPTTMLVGFPIPRVYDGPPHRMHWQPLLLPPPIDTSDKTIHVRKGKKESAGAWSLERVRLFGDDAQIEWRSAEPWAEDRLQVRGALAEPLRRSSVLILGAGAMGSALAELLVRAGVNDLVVGDHELLEVGNLRRHTLDIGYAGYRKSTALAEHLNRCSPFANVRWTTGLWGNDVNENAAVRGADIVIDCTASDDVTARLGTMNLVDRARWFFSGSLGADALRLFFYAHRGTAFPAEAFTAAMRPYVAEERQWLQDRDPFSMQGAGCWNPVFPGRWDDIMALAARMVRAMENAVVAGTVGSALTVTEA
jgi:hypothetical protein